MSSTPPAKSNPAPTPRKPELTAFATFAAQWNFPPDSPRLAAALTHRSAASSPERSNERLEFLGDALLSAFVARYLFHSLPPATGEAALSRARIAIIRKETLAHAARELGVAELLQVGPGERKEQRQHHDSLLADAYEALIAALFLDCGEEAMARFLQETLAGPLAAVTATPPPPDAKTELQMRLQAAGRGLPVYRLVPATGEGHEHHFVVEVADLEGRTLGVGEGMTKRAAQMEAATNALASLSVPPAVAPEAANG